MCLEKVPCMAIYIVKKRGLERLPNDVGFVPNLNINAENLPSLVSGTLHARAGSGLHAHALLGHM